jgi:protoporphyrinogen oxidase
MNNARIRVLGAGVTGLAAGLAGGHPILEASDFPGGVCRTYYIAPGSSTRRWHRAPAMDDYRFEIGGGHWLHSRSPAVLGFLECVGPLRRYRRDAAVYIRNMDLFLPYPVQRHADALPAPLAAAVAMELAEAERRSPDTHGMTVDDAHRARFGPTLDALFFRPFHRRYSAGLSAGAVFRESYKTPTAPGAAATSGYNSDFVYPVDGLGALIDRWSSLCDVHYGTRVTSIDLHGKHLLCEDGTEHEYDRLISTLPLDVMCRLTGLLADIAPDPYTSVLVVNIGALRGPRHPQQHWVYVPDSRSGFHRVGIYDNVDADFLPATDGPSSRTALYVERSYPAGRTPSPMEQAGYITAMVEELREWGFIEPPEVIDATWIETAYTWILPGSCWRTQALEALRAHDIHQVGRYGRWENGGIADSIIDGAMVGAALAPQQYRHSSAAWNALRKLSSPEAGALE